MTINTDEIIEACKLLAKQENLKICLRESAKGAAVTGVSSYVGGVLGGPAGLAVGAAVGGVAAATMCKQYKPLWEVIEEMNSVEKRRLAAHITRVLNQLNIGDVAVLMTLVANPHHLGRDLLITELGVFFGQALTR